MRAALRLTQVRIVLAVLACVVFALLVRAVNDPPNADPHKGKVWIHDGSMWSGEYDHYTVCIGPNLYEVYDDWYDDKYDHESKTPYADECERG